MFYTSHVIIILVYVDDIIIFRSSGSYGQKLICELRASFNLKNLDDLSYFLGIQVTQAIDGIHHNQHKYIMDLMNKESPISYKALLTSMSSITRFSNFDDELINNLAPYK